MGIAERKERERQKRWEDIVAAAEKVFFSKGFVRSTMEEIAEAAELSKGTLYLYFKSKEDLHMVVARKAIGCSAITPLQLLKMAGMPWRKLRLIGLACVEFATSHPDHMSAIMTLEEMEPGGISLLPLIFRILFTGNPQWKP